MQSRNSCSRDFDLSYECRSFCYQIQSNCLADCEESRECEFSCDYSAAACTNSCPCFQDCPTGCNDCATEFCSCRDYETNENYKECKKHHERDYDRCVLSCEAGDFTCLAVCSRDFNNAVETCPCKSGCPLGCPCPDYECTNESTTTVSPTAEPGRKTTVLVLSTDTDASGYPNRPLLIDSDGRKDEKFYFYYEAETSVLRSCSLVWENKPYIFGGSGPSMRQISRLDNCKLSRVGTLDFNFEEGGCANTGDRRFYLCFSKHESGLNKCHYASDISQVTTMAAQSLHNHGYTRIASSDSNLI